MFLYLRKRVKSRLDLRLWAAVDLVPFRDWLYEFVGDMVGFRLRLVHQHDWDRRVPYDLLDGDRLVARFWLRKHAVKVRLQRPWYLR